MTTIRFVPLAALAALALSGCYLDLGHGYGSDDPWTAPPSDPYDPGSGTIAVEAISLHGDMGDVRGFDGNIASVDGTDYDGYASVQVHAQNSSARWAVMSMVNVDGGLHHPSLVPGAHFSFSSTDYGTYDPSGSTAALHVSVMGCSGNDPGVWAFDQYADQVEVDVVDGAAPNTVEIRYDATFNGSDYGTSYGAQTVHGSFAYGTTR